MCSSAAGCPAEVSLSNALKARQHQEHKNLDFSPLTFVQRRGSFKGVFFPVEFGEEFHHYPE